MVVICFEGVITLDSVNFLGLLTLAGDVLGCSELAPLPIYRNS